MDPELLVRLMQMQMQMVTHTYSGNVRDRTIKGPDFALILASLMDGADGGRGSLPPRQAGPESRKAPTAPGVKKGAYSTQNASPGAGVKNKGMVRRSEVSGAGLEAMVDRVAVKYGIAPELLNAVVRVESDYNPLAVSGAGAMGLMQLMPGTARSLGVKNPFDPLENLEGGARYLKAMFERFNGDLNLALAAYNAGPGAVEKYGGVPPYRETVSYLKKIKDLLGGSSD